MNRSTLPLAVLFLAGLLFAVAAPTASAQSAADCPNTVRAVNGCDSYVPARAAQPEPHRAPASAGRATHGLAARPTGDAPAARQPAVQEGSALTFYPTRAAFNTAHPGLPVENFEDLNAPPGSFCTSPSPVHSGTNNPCVSTGDIAAGLSVAAEGPNQGDPEALVAIGAGALGTNYGDVVLGANFFADNTALAFSPGVAAVGMDVYTFFGGGTTTVEVYDTSNNLMGSTSVPGTTTVQFVGVSSDAAPIGRIVLVLSNDDTFVDDVAFGGGGGGGAKHVMYAPSEDDDPAYRAAIAAALGAGSVVDYFDARAATPTVAQMLAYDAVYTWTNFAYLDRVAFGNNLAAYVDAGGAVVLGTFTTYDSGNSLGGAIRGPAYSPVANPSGTNHFSSSNYAGDGTIFYTGVSTTTECFYRDFLVTQGSGAVDGHFVDTEIMGAYRPDFQVMFMNGDGAAQLGCTGNWARLLANMVLQSNSGPSCDLKYLSADLVYNPGTRRLCARVTVRNNGTAPRTARLELDYNRNGGAPQGTRILGSGTLPGGAQATREVCLRVPGAAPAGSSNFDLRLVDVATGSTCGSYQETIAISEPRLSGEAAFGPLFEVEEMADFAAAASAVRGGGVAVAPNPFARQTAIAYEVAATADVRLAVYDVLGREVAVLVDGHVEAGAHTATFDARGLAAGTYVYRLVVGGAVQTGRMTLAH